MELEERLVKLEAENAVQTAVIRALVEMLPPMNAALDVPLTRAVQTINNRAADEPEPMKQALQDALAGLNPMQIPRRRG
jgi:uncharacterized coiled-coil protein SlyX